MPESESATQEPGATSSFAPGYPHLKVVKASIRLLYKSLPRQTLMRFAKSFDRAASVLPDGVDLVIGVQLLAGAIVRHLGLPKGAVVVSFREMENAGCVELTEEDDYLVDLNSKYRTYQRDIAAVLAHEITHVFLHRHGGSFPDTFENEILTDTASVYLGVGWLSLNAHRVSHDRHERDVGPGRGETVVTTTDERIGYLTPDEFGYVLAKRSLAFGEQMDGLISEPAAAAAFRRGFERAYLDQRCPPLRACGWWQRLGYYRNRRYIQKVSEASGLSGISRQFGGYHFDLSETMRVIFECPRCSQKLRLPTGKRLKATCKTCDSSLECRT